jgi:uncharacterized membrane-anchored protein
MIRILLFVVLLLGLGFFIQTVSEVEGQVVVHFYDYEITTSTQFIFIISAILGLILFFIGQVWAFLVQSPQNFEKWRYIKRYDQGFQCFMGSLESLKEGDIKTAQKLGKKTQKLLPNQNLKSFLAAEISVHNKEPIKAIEHYNGLSQNKNSQWIGLSGLIEQYTLLEDWANVRKYAAQAYVQKQKNRFVLESWFKASFYENDYDRILKLLPNMQKYSSYTSEFLDQVESSIYMDKAMQAPSSKASLKFYQKSLKVYESNIPAFEAYFALDESNISKKLKILNGFFKKCPHLKLYKLWLNTIKNEPTRYYKRRLKAFLKGQKNEFINCYIQAQESFRLNQYLETIVWIEKAENQCFDSSLSQLKLLTLNKLGKIDALTDELEKERVNAAFRFKGEESFIFQKLWQDKQIFKTEKQDYVGNIKLLTHG